jgi:hypothetical protein
MNNKQNVEGSDPSFHHFFILEMGGSKHAQARSKPI